MQSSISNGSVVSIMVALSMNEKKQTKLSFRSLRRCENIIPKYHSFNSYSGPKFFFIYERLSTLWLGPTATATDAGQTSVEQNLVF